MLIWLGTRVGLALMAIGVGVCFATLWVGVPLAVVGAIMFCAARADEGRNA